MSMSISTGMTQSATYVCSGLALVILIARLGVCKLQPHPFDLSFWLTLLSCFVVIARLIITYYVLEYNTVGDTLIQQAANGDTSSSEGYYKLKVGSILSLVLRVLLTTHLWLMCVLLLLLYRRFIHHLVWMRSLITGTYIFIGLSYVGVLLATFLECRPFHLYWQITPDPGTCIKEYIQISVQTVSNIIIDLLLMAISIPILFVHGQPVAYRARLGGLVSLGLFCIATTIARLVDTFRSDSSQDARTFWASISVLVATFVANAPVLYGSIKLRSRRKSVSNPYPRDDTSRSYGGTRRHAKDDEELAMVKMTGMTQHQEMAILKMTAVTQHEETASSFAPTIGDDDERGGEFPCA